MLVFDMLVFVLLQRSQERLSRRFATEILREAFSKRVKTASGTTWVIVQPPRRLRKAFVSAPTLKSVRDRLFGKP
jgi:hypothetical protein